MNISHERRVVYTIIVVFSVIVASTVYVWSRISVDFNKGSAGTIATGGACTADSQCASGYCDTGGNVCRIINLGTPGRNVRDLNNNLSNPKNPYASVWEEASSNHFFAGRTLVFGTNVPYTINLSSSNPTVPFLRSLDIRYILDGVTYDRTITKPSWTHGKGFFGIANFNNNYPNVSPTAAQDNVSDVNGKLMWRASPGLHKITYIIDPLNQIKEVNQTANTPEGWIEVVGNDGKPYNPALTGKVVGSACTVDSECASKFCADAVGTWFPKTCRVIDFHAANVNVFDIATVGTPNAEWRQPNINNPLLAGHKYMLSVGGLLEADMKGVNPVPFVRPIDIRYVIDGVKYDRTMVHPETSQAAKDFDFGFGSKPASEAFPTTEENGRMIWTATPGNHTIETIIDPFGKIYESCDSYNDSYASSCEDSKHFFSQFLVVGEGGTPVAVQYDSSTPVTATVNNQVAGEDLTVLIKMKNTGTAAWTSTDNANYFALGILNDDPYWGVTRVKLAPGESILPGATKEFRFTLKNPVTKRNDSAYKFRWRMVKASAAGDTWFGGAVDTPFAVKPPLAILPWDPVLYPKSPGFYGTRTDMRSYPAPYTVRIGDTLKLGTIQNKSTNLGTYMNQPVTWSSSNASVATIDAKGVVTGLTPGIATITAVLVSSPAISGNVAIVVPAEKGAVITGPSASTFIPPLSQGCVGGKANNRCETGETCEWYGKGGRQMLCDGKNSVIPAGVSCTNCTYTPLGTTAIPTPTPTQSQASKILSCSDALPINRADAARFLAQELSLAVQTAGGPHFADVPVSHPDYSYIETIYNKGITGGCSISPLKYCPSSPTTRGAFVTFAVRAKGIALINQATPSFNDVPKTHPLYRFIESAKAAGLIAGYSDGTFKPDDTILANNACSILKK